MPRKTLPCIFIALLCTVYVPCVSAATKLSAENERLLMRLDSLVDNHETTVREKEIRLDVLRNALKKADSDARRLDLMSQLYEEYFVYDSDSAMYYASESAALAARGGVANYDTLAEWRIKEAFVDIAQGCYDKAMEILDSIDVPRLSPRIRAEFYSVKSFCFSMRALYMKSNKKRWNDEMAMANAYRDSLVSQNLPITDEYLWVPVAVALDGEEYNITDDVIAKLKHKVDNTSIASRNNAIDAYWLARYYAHENRDEEMVKYMTLAAIYDAEIVNREIAAIQDLSTYLFEHEQLNRAYNYMIYNALQASTYHNRIRLVSMSDSFTSVRDAYRAELEKRDRTLSRYVWVLALLSLVLLTFIVFIILEFRKLKKMRNLLHATNQELSASVRERDSAIAKLEKVNNELSEANEQKLDILAYTFKQNSTYINALENYRKLLLRKFKTKRIDELGVLINDPDLIREQYQEFLESLDKIILSIFPRLVEEYNSTMPEECHVSPASVTKTKTINTKLRIYALRRLGVHKSADIAQMLNISIRTVYNNRTPNADDPADQ
ncbi:MAG: hypothetical protein K2L96_02145 [Muribaculaceae bacterium]|nr:hypothetical protein [Muribaculaceae bacterium]